MPSFRLIIDILGVRPGTDPVEVLPQAERILATTYRVEDRSIEVDRPTSAHPQPQVHLRFLVPTSSDEQENEQAEQAVIDLAGQLQSVAICGRWQLLRGPGRNWRPLASGQSPPPPAEQEAPVSF